MLRADLRAYSYHTRGRADIRSLVYCSKAGYLQRYVFSDYVCLTVNGFPRSGQVHEPRVV
jgi:hypothetical protein